MSGGLAEDVATILSAVVAQLRRLSDDEVKALAAGEVEFRLVPKPTPRPVKPPVPESPAGVDPEEVRAALADCASEAAATEYLRALKLTPASAKQLATGLGLRPSTSARATIAEIVRVYVAGRLNAATVQHFGR
jgi:hypothetical protein